MPYHNYLEVLLIYKNRDKKNKRFIQRQMNRIFLKPNAKWSEFFGNCMALIFNFENEFFLLKVILLRLPENSQGSARPKWKSFWVDSAYDMRKDLT